MVVLRDLVEGFLVAMPSVYYGGEQMQYIAYGMINEMAKKQQKSMTRKKKTAQAQETDSAYFLKIVLYIILGSLWIKFGTPLQLGNFALNGAPIGLLIGLVFARHDHFQVDRKIEYVVLIGMTILTMFYPAWIAI